MLNSHHKSDVYYLSVNVGVMKLRYDKRGVKNSIEN